MIFTIHLILSELLNLRRLKWADHVAKIEDGRNAVKIFIKKLTYKRLLGRSRYRWKDNIRMDFAEKARRWTGSSWLRIGISGGLSWMCIETLCSLSYRVSYLILLNCYNMVKPRCAQKNFSIYEKMSGILYRTCLLTSKHIFFLQNLRTLYDRRVSY